MYRCHVFKGFKRSGNHLIIFNIINNIISGGDEHGLEDLQMLKPFVFFNHKKKIVFFNCFDAHLDLYKDLISANLSSDRDLKNSLIEKIDSIFKSYGKDIPLNEIINFVDTRITADYRIFFSIEDTVLVNERSLLNEIFDTDYEVRNYYIIRDIENLYSSRKKSGWMQTGQIFVNEYVKYYYKYLHRNSFIKFEKYIKDDDYRKSIHLKFGIYKSNLLNIDYELPVGTSSFENSNGIFNRTTILSLYDNFVLNNRDLNLIQYKNNNDTMKLHLGCASKHIDGFINVDVRDLPGVDVIDDIITLEKFENESADLIYVSHVLEHTGRREYMNVLKRWFDILKPGGVLRIAVPDFEKVVEHYNENHDLLALRGFLYGGQTYPQNFHYCAWDFKTLEGDLQSIGFTDIKRYDWKDTEHAHIDDFSQCYLPHMDKENGKLMSLNVEATK